MKRRTRDVILANAFLIPLAILWLFPLWIMLVFATLPDAAIFDPATPLIPSSGFLDNARALEEGTEFARSLLNSVVVAAVYTVLSVLLTSMAGWSLARYEFTGKRVVLLLVLGTLALPYFTVVIPQFILVARDMGLSNTWFALIAPPLFNSLGVLFMRQAFGSMPVELFEAARIEGVSEWRIFRHVALPIAKPTLAALAIILFLASWNNYLWPLLITNDPEMMTAPVALGALIGLTRVSWGAIMAGSLLMTIPMLVLFMFLQKYFISGVTAGAVK